ncbi:unnamed protein product [Rotaria sp. Silwood2]|nr:unnamed protein product [Rotaria sp. Silwood2]CAF3217414.1 unnamed protein product [Rotaria sp. Silwood2]CAF3397860.1 unnamed protein product [Rotaria sp. Silwood2]CAF3484616.1 unnamed protein product [Rotaria sp. Silwood2]CAF4532351.1 unnamed protein product [Rotaria sp. Silwood2]
MAFIPVSSLTVNGLPKFLSMIYHQLINQSIYTFADLGIADRLIHAQSDRGFTVEEIISDDQQQWNRDLLYRILRACIYVGIVESINDDKHFILTESGIMMTSDHSSHVRDLIRFSFGPICSSASLQLPNMVRGEGTGSGIARVSGGLDFYTLMSQPDQEEFLQIFSGAMTAFSIQNGSQLVTAVDFGSFKTIVDIGGNRGTFLAQLLEKYPSIQHGTVFDLSHIVNKFKNGEEFELRKIHKNKWSFLSGNMYDSSTVPLADAYVLKHILHDFDDNKCLEILSSIRKANENEKDTPTVIFIIEHIILPNEALSNWQSHAIDIGMAILFDNARERTQDEYEELLKKTGFQLKKMYPIQAPNSIIEAVLVR